MQAIELFAAIVRSADALERIANSLDYITAGGRPSTFNAETSAQAPAYSDPDLEGGGQGPDTIDGTVEKPKRTRRTKAEIEADKAAAAAGVTRPPEVPAALAPVEAPAFPLAPPVVQAMANGSAPTGTTLPAAAPVVPQPLPTEAPAFQSQFGQPAATGVQAPSVPPVVPPVLPPVPVAAHPTAVDPHVLAQYAALPAESQFTHLLQIFAANSDKPLVRDALVNKAGEFGLSLPFSDPADRSIPGANYKALLNQYRVELYAVTAEAANRVKAAAQQGQL